MPEEYTYDERQILACVAEGDEKAFRILFDKWHQKLAGFVVRWTDSQHLAEEVVQDVFLKIWTFRQTLPGVDNFDRYLYILSRNHSLNALRTAARRHRRFKRWLADKESEIGLPADFSAPDHDYHLLLEEAVHKLPEQQKRVYRLKYQEGKKYKGIGEELGIAPETARKHMQAAVGFISKYLRNHLPPTLVISFFFAGHYPLCCVMVS